MENYDLAATLASGQAFRWRERDGGWNGVVGGRWVRLRAEPGRILAETAADVSDWEWLRHYLQLDLNLAEILAAFPRDDEALQTAAGACAGLRLLRQEPWECLASFICSSSKQIVQIQQIIALLSRRFGEPLSVPSGHEPAWSFPALWAAGGGVGVGAAGMQDGFSRPLPSRRGAKTGGRRSGFGPALRPIAGPGARGTAQVARRGDENRGLCFAVWLWFCGGLSRGCLDPEGVAPALFPAPRSQPARLRRFIRSHFGPHAGYAQQYLFHYTRTRHKLAPMRTTLKTLFTPAEFEALRNCDLSNTVCVVFDVLRATTSMLTALRHGAERIVPVLEISEALALRGGLPGALLAGERDGVRIRAAQTGGVDFDLGNSPREFTPGRVAGKTIIITTTNGTRALQACQGARRILAGAFVNLGALARWIQSEQPDNLLLVGAGTFEEAAYEDTLAAGALSDLVWGQFSHPADSAQIAREIYLAGRADLADALERHSRNARRLLADPDLREDVPFSIQLDTVPFPATLTDGAVTILN